MTTTDAGGTPDLTAREQEIVAAHAPCRTAPNGTGARCTCDFDCANYWLRAERRKSSTPGSTT